MAASRSLSKVDVMPEIIDETVQAHHNILESLEAHADAHSAYVSFFRGHINFYGAPRYKLEEVMSESRPQRLLLEQCWSQHTLLSSASF